MGDSVGESGAEVRSGGAVWNRVCWSHGGAWTHPPRTPVPPSPSRPPEGIFPLLWSCEPVGDCWNLIIPINTNTIKLTQYRHQQGKTNSPVRDIFPECLIISQADTVSCPSDAQRWWVSGVWWTALGEKHLSVRKDTLQHPFGPWKSYLPALQQAAWIIAIFFHLQGTLASQNTKMISSIVISQLIDENKSKENGAALPVPCAHPMKPSLANSSRVTINRAFEFLPGGLGVQTPVGEPGLETKPPPKEEKPCSGSQKGFASITITARRVGPPASTLVWEALGDPLCVKCRSRDALLGDPSALAGGADPTQHHGPFTCTEFSRNSCVMGLKVPKAHAQLCEGHGYWITNVDHREDQFSPGTSRSRAGKSPLVFSSCVHLRVSQSCPNPIYYLDRSVSVPVEPPQLAGPKMHRSVLSLNLSCSSHRLTPDGVDDTENREPGSGALKPELREGDQDLLGPRWNLGLQGSFLKENPSLGQMDFGNLEAGRCPWRGSPPLENAEAGTNQITMRKRKEDQVTRWPTRGHNQANQLSIHIPGWSYTAGGWRSHPPCHQGQTPPRFR